MSQTTSLVIVLILMGIFLYGIHRGKRKRKRMTRTCANCKSQIPIDARVCPYCRRKVGYFDDFGAEMRGGATEMGCILWFLVIAVAIAGLIILYGMLSSYFGV